MDQILADLAALVDGEPEPAEVDAAMAWLHAFVGEPTAEEMADAWVTLGALVVEHEHAPRPARTLASMGARPVTTASPRPRARRRRARRAARRAAPASDDGGPPPFDARLLFHFLRLHSEVRP